MRNCPGPILLGSVGVQRRLRVEVARRDRSASRPDDHLGDDPPADGPEVEPVRHHLGLLQDVVPERRRPIELVRP